MNKSPLTKEEVQRDYKRAQDRKLIKERFYPALVDATISVDEAQMLLQAANSLIMEEAMEILRIKKMDEIKNRVVRKLCPDDTRLLKIENLISVFDGMSLFEVRGHFESMGAVLRQMTTDEMRNRPLSSMNPAWERYLST